MKKLFAILLIAFFFTTAKSQIYIEGGINPSNITTTQQSQTQKNSSLTSFNAGVLDRFNFKGPLYFETGLLLEGKGSKSRINISPEDYYTAVFNPFYLEVPADLVFRLSFPKKSKLFIDAGPYIAMGIAGQTKSEGNIGGVEIKYTTDINFSNSKSNDDGLAYSDLKRFDYGINFGAGLDFRTVLFKMNYGLGLSQINATQIDPVSTDKNKYRTVSISLGVPLTSL